MRVVIGFSVLVVLGYVGAITLLYVLQDRFVFPAFGTWMSAGEARVSGLQDVVITTADGERLAGWWRPPEAGRALLVYLHGNGGSLANRRDRIRLLAADGRGILIITYRGYPGSTGMPTEAGLRLDAEAAYDWTRSYDPARLVLYGESLGTGVAIRLASEHRVGAVILDAPFTSLPDVAGRLIWFAPVDLLLRSRFPSIDRVASIGAPLLVMHGERDTLIPIALGERLFAAAREPKRLVRLPDASHVDVLERGGLPAVQAFLAAVERTAGSEAPVTRP